MSACYVQAMTLTGREARYLRVQKDDPRVQWVRDFREATRFTDQKEVEFHRAIAAEALSRGHFIRSVSIIDAAEIERRQIEEDLVK